jgi:hypothetical protein
MWLTMLTAGIPGLDELEHIFWRVNCFDEVKLFLLDEASYAFTMPSFSKCTRQLNGGRIVVNIDVVVTTYLQ